MREKRDCAPNAFSGKELKIRKINLTATVYLNEVTKKVEKQVGNSENEIKRTRSAKKERKKDKMENERTHKEKEEHTILR